MTLESGLSVVQPHNRLIGNMPKVGIRPIIDGRFNGIRESLEGPTMALARNVADLIEKKLKHANGLSIECVLADTCIGGVAEAAKTADKFSREGVGVSISVTPCWCYGAETMDMDPHIPKAILGFNGTERPGAVYLAAVMAAHNQKGLPAFGIYGKDVQDASDLTIPDDVEGKLLQFVRAGLAAATMKGKSYLSMGGVSMGIAGSMVDHTFFERYLGMRVETIDMSEFIRRIEEGIFDREEFARALVWVKKYCREGADHNPPDRQRSRLQKDGDWEMVVKMTLIARDLMVGNPALARMGFYEESFGHNAIVSGFQGQRQWTDHFPNGDFMEAILNSSFDWNGIREPYLIATENDSLNGATMLFGHLLTGRAQVFADVRTYWSHKAVKRVTGKMLTGLAENGFIHLINSGSAALEATGKQKENGTPVIKNYWEMTEEDALACLEATSWYPANTEYFRGGGYSSGFHTQATMPVTLARLNLIKGLGPALQIAEGFTIELPTDIHEVLSDRTDPTWPTTWFVPILSDSGPFENVYSVMNNWGTNHGVMSYGHIGGDLISLASILRIPVSIHNVPKNRIFRPAIWSAFGTLELESADYRACQLLGPLY